MKKLSIRSPRHALSGEGPIINSARSALKRTAELFGEISASTDTYVDVLTSSGFRIRLSYDPGNYVFSRVYNLTISITLAQDSPLERSRLVFQRQGAPVFVNPSGKQTRNLGRFNKEIKQHLDEIDVHSARITAQNSRKTFTVVPFGGAYVWVLIPPVFKATTFPAGEPERILNLLQSVLDFRVPVQSPH